MKVGDTFFIDGTEFSIKNIDNESTEKFPVGRVDASRFIGSHGDLENPRTIQRGRPKMFHRKDVAEALGETLPTTEVTSDVEMSDEASESWTKMREATTISFSDTDNTKSTPPVYTTSTDW